MTTQKRQPRYAVVRWQADSRYRLSAALAIYVTEQAAEKAAERFHNNPAYAAHPGGIVVRDIEYMLD